MGIGYRGILAQKMKLLVIFLLFGLTGCQSSQFYAWRAQSDRDSKSWDFWVARDPVKAHYYFMRALEDDRAMWNESRRR